MITLAVGCDGCGRMYAKYDAVSHSIFSDAKRDGWSVARDKKKGDDLCPVCIDKRAAKDGGPR